MNNLMKGIAYQGAWSVSILCFLLVIIKLINLIVLTFQHVTWEPVEGSLTTLSVVIMLFISVVCAWIACDMKKRFMKGDADGC